MAHEAEPNILETDRKRAVEYFNEQGLHQMPGESLLEFAARGCGLSVDEYRAATALRRSGASSDEIAAIGIDVYNSDRSVSAQFYKKV